VSECIQTNYKYSRDIGFFSKLNGTRIKVIPGHALVKYDELYIRMLERPECKEIIRAHRRQNADNR